MEKIPIKVTKDEETYLFEIVDYVHHSSDRCKFEVYAHGDLIASFEPDPNGHLQICKNNGSIDDELLHLLADKIETFNW